MLFMVQKEVNRLRGLVNGGAENLENDSWTVGFPGSPGSFKWDGGLGSFSPLTSEKRSIIQGMYHSSKPYMVFVQYISS